MGFSETVNDDGLKIVHITRETIVAKVNYDTLTDVLELSFTPGPSIVGYVDHPHVALLTITDEQGRGQAAGFRVEAVSEFIKPGIIDELDRAKEQILKDGRACVWEYVNSNDYWQTGCGGAFSLDEGTPAQNDIKFCPYCGHSLVESDVRSCGLCGEGFDYEMRDIPVRMPDGMIENTPACELCAEEFDADAEDPNRENEK